MWKVLLIHSQNVKYQRNVLDELFLDGFGVEFGSEAELQHRFALDVLRQNFLVEFEPCGESFLIGVLQAEVPNLAQANRFHDLQKRSRLYRRVFSLVNTSPQRDKVVSFAGAYFHSLATFACHWRVWPALTR